MLNNLRWIMVDILLNLCLMIAPDGFAKTILATSIIRIIDEQEYECNAKTNSK